jgi:ATP synthase protein I
VPSVGSPQLNWGFLAVADDPDRARLEALDRKIAKAKGVEPKKPHTDNEYSQAQLAWRMVIELVAGLGIGFGIGYGLDTLAGTKPLFMVLFILIGFVAGVKTMLRSAREVQDRRMALEAAEKGEGSDVRRS